MTKKAISPGAVHSVPADLRKVLISDPAARAKWEDITPLARNEWICWVISVKKPETRGQHAPTCSCSFMGVTAIHPGEQLAA
jgi:uncharacterized protein YdeI (YjbR/CyaY-like superfamily)